MSDDGAVLKSDVGVGILKAGWNCAGNPNLTGGAQSASVQITPQSLKVELGETATLTADGFPGGGTYTWSVDNPSIVNVSSTSGPSVTVKGLAVGRAKITVRYICPSGAPATATAEVKVTTKELVIVGWIDRNAVQFPTGGSSLLVGALSGDPITCSGTVGTWALLGLRILISDDIDRQYANAFLISNSANSDPGLQIDAGVVRSIRDYRSFARLKVFFENQGGQIVNKEAIIRDADVGLTPDPCRSSTPFGAQARPKNDTFDVTAARDKVYLLSEGRVGDLGQRANRTLNFPNVLVSQYPTVTPVDLVCCRI